jgi:hypothetical protein
MVFTGGFVNMKTKFQKHKASFHQTTFCDFDGFAKLHPSTLLFRETIVVTRNQPQFDGLVNGRVKDPQCRRDDGPTHLKRSLASCHHAVTTHQHVSTSPNMVCHCRQPAGAHQLGRALCPQQCVAWRCRVCANVLDMRA